MISIQPAQVEKPAEPEVKEEEEKGGKKGGRKVN